MCKILFWDTLAHLVITCADLLQRGQPFTLFACGSLDPEATPVQTSVTPHRWSVRQSGCVRITKSGKGEDKEKGKLIFASTPEQPF